VKEQWLLTLGAWIAKSSVSALATRIYVFRAVLGSTLTDKKHVVGGFPH
jgi:hypothetical protein